MGTAHSCMVDKSGGKGKWTDLLLKNKCLTFFGVSVVFLFFIVIIFLVTVIATRRTSAIIRIRLGLAFLIIISLVLLN